MKSFAVCALMALFFEAFAISSEHVADWKDFKAQYGEKNLNHEDPVSFQRSLAEDNDIEAVDSEENNVYGLGQEVSAPEISDVDSEVVLGNPASFDWRNHDILSPVRDQEDCGASYAFAANEVVESHLRMTANLSLDLSEQFIIDCTFKKYKDNQQNDGCTDGFPGIVFKHYNKFGLVTEDQYPTPYLSGESKVHRKCQLNEPGQDVVKIKLTPRHLRPSHEGQLQDMLLRHGPLIVKIATDDNINYHFYELKDEVFDRDEYRTRKPTDYVVLVGYGYQGNKPYWIIKNSWGTSWGDKGYGKIRRNKNMCNLLRHGVWYLA